MVQLYGSSKQVLSGHSFGALSHTYVSLFLIQVKATSRVLLVPADKTILAVLVLHACI